MRHVNQKRGAELVDAARVAMLTRERDLERLRFCLARMALDSPLFSTLRTQVGHLGGLRKRQRVAASCLRKVFGDFR